MSLALNFDLAFGRLAATAILGYQRHLSPWKGFVCAHRVVHGGASCSEHIRRLVAAEGLLAGLRALQPRLLACREAAALHRERSKALLRSRGFDEYFDPAPGANAAPRSDDEDKRQRAKARSCEFGPDVNQCLPNVGSSRHTNVLDCNPFDGNGCHFDPPDIGGCDLPAVDCCG